MHSKIKLILLIVFTLVAKGIGAQTDTLSQKNDSLSSLILQNYNKKIATIEERRLQDSLRREELQAQLNSLRTTDNLKKEELQQKLQDLSNKEIQRVTQKKAQIDSLRRTVKAYPVSGFFSDTLFLIYSKLGSFSAKDRADAISGRIEKLKDDLTFKTEQLRVVEAETTIDIVYNESIVMSISENDVIWNNTIKMDLAQNYQQIIGKATETYLKETSFSTLAGEISLALLVLLAAIIFIFNLNKLFRWTAKEIEAQEGKRIHGIKIRNSTLFNAKQQINVFLNVNTTIKWLLIALLVYIALPVLFGIFPWTKNLAETLFGYILNPVKKMALGLWNYLPNLITIIVIVTIFTYFLKGVRFLKTEIANGHISLSGFYPDWANPTYQIVRIITFSFMLVVIFPYLPGSDSPVFQGISVFLGFLFTFGSAGSLSNIIAGLVLTYMRLFKIGDRVKIGEVTGDVIEKSLLVTRIRTIKNEIISIPNSTVMSSHTINYCSDAVEKGLILHTTITIGYDVPWKQVHQALLDAADRTDMVLKDPQPFVLQTSLEDFYVAYQINAYTREPNKQAVMYSQLHQNIQDCCNESGIEILSPHYRAARDGNMSTIPANYLDKDYQVPRFNVNITK